MASLTHASEVVSETLNEMSGATSPKLQLELMCAKVLVPAADESETGSLARIERLERRIGMGGGAATSAPAQASSPAASTPTASAPAAAAAVPSEAVAASVVNSGLTTQHVKDVWKDILAAVNKESKSAWMVAFALQVINFDAAENVLTLQFSSARDLETFKGAGNAPEVLRKAIDEILGITVKFKPQIADSQTKPIAIVKESAPVEPVAAVEAPAEVVDEPDDVSLLEEEAEKVAEPAAEVVAEKPKAKSRNSKMVDEEARYGESLLREMLGAEPVDDKKNGR
jgi:DNA polymerase-3 subunit gamma/tau